MRIAVSMYSYVTAVKEGRLDIASFIHEAKRAGAQGVELLDFFYKDVSADRERAMAALQETGLPCPIFSVGQNFAKPDAQARQAELRKIQFGVEEAVHYGAGTVRVFAGDVAEGMTFEQARGWIIDGLVEASIYAHEKGIKLALENHGRLAGRGDQVCGIIEDVRQRTGTSTLGANPDFGNFILVNQPSHEAVEQVAGYAYMAHFKDFKTAGDEAIRIYTALDGRKYVGTAVGEGEVQLEPCLKSLENAGFTGWLSVEYEGTEDPLVAVPRSIANARRFL